MYAFEPKFRHVLTSEIHVVEISYKGDGFSMIIVSPRKIGGLKEVEYSLTTDSFKQWRDTMTLIQYAKIQLPMFTINSNYDDILKSSLVKLGTSNVFAPNVSNFYKLSAENLYVDKIVHKALITVDEKGDKRPPKYKLEGSATGIMPRANHPFLFAIWGDKTESILFMGRIVDPTT